jgi:hypothetical protein
MRRYIQKNHFLADFLASLIRPVPKQCYRNSVLAMFAYHEPSLYVEGLLSISYGTLFVPHGWLEVKGAVVDVTLDDQMPSDYYGLFRYDQGTVLDAVNHNNSLPLFDHTADTRRVVYDMEHHLALHRGKVCDERIMA